MEEYVVITGYLYRRIHNRLGWHWVREDRYVTKQWNPDIEFVHLDGDRLNSKPENIYPVDRKCFRTIVRRINGNNPQVNKAIAMTVQLEFALREQKQKYPTTGHWKHYDAEEAMYEVRQATKHLNLSSLYGYGTKRIKERD